MTDSSTDWKRKPLYQNCGDAYRKHDWPDLQELIVLGGRFDHCHEEPNQRNIEKQKVRTECKRKAEEEPCERPCKLIIQESRGGTM